MSRILVLEIGARACQMSVLDADADCMKVIRDLHNEMFPVKYMSTFFEKLSRCGSHHCILFDFRRRYVGVCTFRTEGRSAYVMTFGIRERYRKRRLGTRFLGEVEKYLKGRWDIIEVSLHVQECNLLGLQFYESCGFYIVNLVPNYYLRLWPRSAYLLRKEI